MRPSGAAAIPAEGGANAMQSPSLRVRPLIMAGQKEVLGLWVAQQEGAKFWLQVLTELKNRGVKDIFMACVDGLKGFPEAIEAIYPQTEVQLCIVHLVRASLRYVPWKHRKVVAADLRRIYRAATAEEAQQNLEEVTRKWSAYPSVSQVWQRNWDRITPFFHYPAEIRKAIYTTNSVEALHRSLRKIIKTRGAFPNAALKLLFLPIRQASKKWTMPVQNWSQPLNYFTVLWPDRMPKTRSVGIMHLSSFLRGRKGRGTAPFPCNPSPTPTTKTTPTPTTKPRSFTQRD